MWNQLQTGAYEGMLAETVSMHGHGGERIHAYMSRPLGEGPYPGILLVPHRPGWDELNREVARRFSQHGYVTICPDIYDRTGHGHPEEIAVTARAAGDPSDDSVMGDCEGAVEYLGALPYSSGRVGVIGMCSGGRHAFMAGCRVAGIHAAVDCWGGRIVMPKEELCPATPVAPIDMTSQLSCPLLGIFGNDDMFPSPEQVDMHEEELKKHGKDYQFVRYDGAGHAFWSYDRDVYRPAQAMDAWEKVFAFFDRHLRCHT